MAKVVGDIAVKVGADVRGFQRDMKRAGGSVEDFDARAKKMAVNVAKAGAAIAVAAAAAAGAILKMAGEASAAGIEIRNLAQISNTSTTQFQRLADGARTVGIEQQKLADILKDVNDKVGDFIVTGGGPMADFFENIAPKVGVTADQFARLGGPEALQLYVTSLERAGVSQQQMTFYMEALASDATALLPLLRDNGAEFRRLGDEAERAGRVMSQETIDAAVELDKALADMANTIKVSATEAVLEHKDELLALVSFISETLIPALAEIVGVLATVAEGWREIGRAANDAISPLARAAGLLDDESSAIVSPEQEAENQADVSGANDMGGSDPSSTGLFYVDENGDVRSYGEDDTPSLPGITAPERVYSGRGQAAGPTPDEALQAFIEARKEGLAEVEEVEEEHASRVASIREDHVRDMAALEAAANRQRLHDISGAFGDLSSLMQSENKKMFKIGQVAAVAQATVSGYQAAVDAWQKGMKIGGPPVAAAFTAASLAKTGMLISQIQSASASGGGGSGSAGSGGGSTATAAPEQQPATTFQFTIQNDPMGFGESFARQMIEQLNQSQRNGGRIQGVIT